MCDIAEENAQQKNGPAESYNPWPGYMFTGKLRPFPVVSLVNVLRQMLLSSIVVNSDVKLELFSKSKLGSKKSIKTRNSFLIVS